MSPCDIYLSRSEMRLLKSLKKDQRYFDDCSEKYLLRLSSFKLCEIIRIDSPMHGDPVIVAITGLGLNYLAYKKSQTTHTFFKCIAWLIGIAVTLGVAFVASP